MSVPSSTSSTYSALPPTQPQWGHSPNLSIGSTTSLSGQSSPGALYSPAVTHSGMLPASLQYPPGPNHMPWSAPPYVQERPHREHKHKFRSASSGALPPDTHVPLSAPADAQPATSKTTGPSPAKRRKSEPEPEEFRDKAKDGASSGISDEMWSPGSIDRPRTRRVASDGVTIPAAARTAETPPMPSTYAEVSTPPFPSQPTHAGSYFASTVIWALTASNSLPQLQAHLGIGAAELEEMKGSLAAVFEQHRLQNGMRSVSLSSSVALTESEAESVSPETRSRSCPLTVQYVSSGHLSTATSDSEPPSPARFAPNQTASYFTPAPTRSSRPMHPPNTMPTFSSMTYSTGVPGLFAESPIPSQAGGPHSRARSLSSAEMVSRGLIVNPAGSNGQTDLNASNQLWPATPSKGRPAPSDASGGSDMISHTPAIGQGFPLSQSMDSLSAISLPVATRHHIRSATDSGQAAYMLGHAHPAMASGGGIDLDQVQGQTSKEDHQRTIRGHTAKTSITSMPLQSPVDGQHPTFGETQRQHQHLQQHQGQQQQQIYQPLQQQNGGQISGQQQQQQQQPFASSNNHRQISISITGSASSSQTGSQTTTPITSGFGGEASGQAQMNMPAAAAGAGFYGHGGGDAGTSGPNAEGQSAFGHIYSAYHAGTGNSGEGGGDQQYR